MARMDRYLYAQWNLKIFNRWTAQWILVGQVETSLDLKPVVKADP